MNDKAMLTVIEVLGEQLQEYKKEIENLKYANKEVKGHLQTQINNNHKDIKRLNELGRQLENEQALKNKAFRGENKALEEADKFKKEANKWSEKAHSLDIALEEKEGRIKELEIALELAKKII